MSKEKVALGVMKDANFPLDPEGRTLHLNCKKGDVNNRIITVGSHSRGELLAGMLDDPQSNHVVVSHRGFIVHSGTFKEVPVSIVVCGMGSPNMDFVVRELRAVIDGEMIIFRLGSCGSLHEDAPPGSLIFASEGSLFCHSDYPTLHSGEETFSYKVEGPVLPDDEFTRHMLKAFDGSSVIVKKGMNCSCDSYYSSQGLLCISLLMSRENGLSFS